MRRCRGREDLGEEAWEERTLPASALALTTRYNACTGSRLKIGIFFLTELTNSMQLTNEFEQQGRILGAHRYDKK